MCLRKVRPYLGKCRPSEQLRRCSETGRGERLPNQPYFLVDLRERCQRRIVVYGDPDGEGEVLRALNGLGHARTCVDRSARPHHEQTLDARDRYRLGLGTT